MNLIAALSEKPWLAPGPGPDAPSQHSGGPEPWDKGVILWLILLVVGMIFALAAMAYMMRMGHGVPAGSQGNDWRTLREPPLLWVNTAILGLSSLAFVAAELGARRGNVRDTKAGLLVGGALGLAFLVGQLLLWRRFADLGFVLLYSAGLCRAGDPLFTFPFPTTILGNPALAFFYLISGLHGAHIVGGLVAWGLTARRVFATGGSPGAARAVQLCARYWHFLLFVWALMMGLFVST